MKRGFILLVTALFCCGFIPQHTASRQAQNLLTEQYTEAIKFATIHHDTVKAMSLLQTVLKSDSMHAPALALMSRLSTDVALRTHYAKRAYEVDTANLHYVKLYQQALIGANSYTKAIPLSYRIVERSTEPHDYYLLAALLSEARRNDEAIAVLDSAYIRLGRVMPLNRMRQHLLIRSGRMLEAESDAKRGVEEEPYNVEGYVALAEVYANTMRDSLALDTYLRAMKIDGDNLELLVSFGDFYIHRQQVGEYLALLDKIFANADLPIDRKLTIWKRLAANTANYRRYYPQYDSLIKRLFILYPQHRGVILQYIEHLIASGDVEQAAVHNKALIFDKGKPQIDALSRVIGMEQYLNRPDSVTKYTELALKLFPKSVEFLQLRGFLALQQGDEQQAIDYHRTALKYADNDTLRSSIWGSIGDIEQRRNEMKRCYNAYNKALQYHSDNALVLNNYAYFLSEEERDLERALTMATRAISLSESNPTFLDTMAWVLYKLGRYDEAKRYMQQAMSLDSEKSSELALHYGDILFALGDKFMAELYWRKALERGHDVKEIEERFERSKKQ